MEKEPEDGSPCPQPKCKGKLRKNFVTKEVMTQKTRRGDLHCDVCKYVVEIEK